MSHDVCSSTSGNWMPWFVDSGLPNGLRSVAYLTDSLTQYCAAPSDDAAWRMRFSLKKCWTTCRPLPSPPKIAPLGTRMLVNDTWAWSVGMLDVHRYSSILKPSESVGVRNAVIPSPSPGLPDVRAMIMSYCALWMPVFHVFSPLITHSSPSRSAWGSLPVASEPWSGSV